MRPPLKTKKGAANGIEKSKTRIFGRLILGLKLQQKRHEPISWRDNGVVIRKAKRRVARLGNLHQIWGPEGQ